jgi:hypothetical protein
LRLPMPRLPDGTFDERTEELEETETNPLTEWLNYNTTQGNIEYMETRNGITYYRVINREAFQ